MFKSFIYLSPMALKNEICYARNSSKAKVNDSLNICEALAAHVLILGYCILYID